MTEREASQLYSKLKVSNFRRLILQRDENSEFAAFYLLRFTLLEKLKCIYNTVSLRAELEDILMEFFLYLRDGRGGKNNRIFQGIEGITSYFAFESWILRTFRNFLLDQLEKEHLQNNAESTFYDERVNRSYDSTNDINIHYLGMLIGIIKCEFSARDRFIFFRSLLACLRQREMIPNEELAPAMGLTYGNYRQIDSRTRKNAKILLQSLIDKSSLSHNIDIQVVKRVENEYEKLSFIIEDLYNDALDSLNCKEAINGLRYPKQSTNSDCESNDDVRYSLKTGRSHNSPFNRFETPSSPDTVEQETTRQVRLRRRSKDYWATKTVLYPDEEMQIDFKEINNKYRCWTVLNRFLEEKKG